MLNRLDLRGASDDLRSCRVRRRRPRADRRVESGRRACPQRRVLDLAEASTGFAPEALRVPPGQVAAALGAIDPPLRAALEGRGGRHPGLPEHQVVGDH
ncbi:MAG: hypothetical protein R2701_07285 [Acidimicrobiales bacterium]